MIEFLKLIILPGGVLVTLIALARECVIYLKDRKPLRAIEHIIKINDSMTECLIKTDAQRILIMKAHNSGGDISPKSKLFCSILYEKSNSQIHPQIGFYQNVPADSFQLEILKTLALKEESFVKFDDIPDGAVLKNTYAVDKVTKAYKFLIDKDDKSLIYCSVMLGNDIDENDPLVKEQIFILKTSLLNAFKKPLSRKSLIRFWKK